MTDLSVGYDVLKRTLEQKLGNLSSRVLPFQHEGVTYNGTLWEATTLEGGSLPWLSQRSLFLGRNGDSRVRVQYVSQEKLPELPEASLPFYEELIGIDVLDGSITITGKLRGPVILARGFNFDRTLLYGFPEIEEVCPSVMSSKMGDENVRSGVVDFSYDGFELGQIEEIVGRVADQYLLKERKPFEFRS